MRFPALATKVVVGVWLCAAAPLLFAQSRAVTPGSYGPEFAEPGFSEKNDLMAAGFQASVNLYGGNLTLSATDVSLAGQGRFRLAFSRAYNSNEMQYWMQTTGLEADGPLGLGWTGHYGLLWLAAPSQTRPEFIDSSGARHLFYLHNQLDGAIPIRSQSGSQTWISTSMEILTRDSANNDAFTLWSPDGLKYSLQRLPQYAYLVPTRIEDVFGNAWTFTYRPEAAPYFEHPLVQSLQDDLGRRLDFEYSPIPANNPLRQRLQRITFDGRVLASYAYLNPPGSPNVFLQDHFTGENRRTRYTTDLRPYPAYGTLTGIESRLGGTTAITYELLSLFYRPAANPTQVYAVRTVTRNDHTWTYDYLNRDGRAPANNEFVVTVTSDDGHAATYTYFTYGLAADTPIWKIGRLLRSNETYATRDPASGRQVQSSRSRSSTYEAFPLSREPQAQTFFVSPVATARTTREEAVQDGFTLATVSRNFDTLNFPRRIDRPGAVVETLDYAHFAGNGRYLLGSSASEETSVSGQLVAKSVRQYRGGVFPILPDSVDLYRDSQNAVHLSLSYSSALGAKGSLERKSFGRYSETYAYQNGVLNSVVYPSGRPNLSRSVNRNGTIASETRDGVTQTFAWDLEFRLTGITPPGIAAPTSIVYATRRVTVTQGGRSLTLDYDEWSRLVSRTESVDGAIQGVRSYASFGSFDLPATETVPSSSPGQPGLPFSLAYDVERRLLSRSNAERTDAYSYATDAAGIATTHLLNGSVSRVTRKDFLGRAVSGSTNGNAVSSTFSGTTQTITPSGQGTHQIAGNFFGEIASETHPESGTTTYSFSSAEAWIDGVRRPVGNDVHTLDDLGRLRGSSRDGAAVLSRDFEPTYGALAGVTHTPEGVDLRYSDFDSLGRPRKLTLTVPRALRAPSPAMPFDWILGPQTGLAYYDSPTAFLWKAGDARARLYQLEVGQPLGNAWNCTAEEPYGIIYRAEVGSPKLPIPFDKLPWRVPLSWRVRAKAASGEVGPFSRWVPFQIEGTRPNYPWPAPLYLRTSVAEVALRLAYGSTAKSTDDDYWHVKPEVGPYPDQVVFEVGMEYDSLGRLSAVTHPGEDTSVDPALRIGKRQVWTYNSQQGHKTVTYDGFTFVRDTSYLPGGHESQWSLPLYRSASGTGMKIVPDGRIVQVSRSYDPLNRLRSLRVMLGERALYCARDLNYDDWEFIESLRRDDDGLRDAVSFGYTPLGQLERWTVGSQTARFRYDAAGNLTGSDVLAVSGLTQYGTGVATAPARLQLDAAALGAYGAGNRPSGAADPRRFDAGGRLYADARYAYSYNALDQIVRVTESQNTPNIANRYWDAAQFLFDGNGERVREVFEDRVVYSVRLPDGRLISQEIHLPGDPSGPFPAKRDFLYHNGRVAATVAYATPWGVPSVDVQYSFHDRMGSPALVLDSAHKFAPEYLEYAPYGQQIRSTWWKPSTTHEFTGHEKDGTIALDYLHARFLSAREARFLRPDPGFAFDMTNPVSFNLYSYVNGNPVNFTDPDGREPAGAKEPAKITAIDSHRDRPLYKPGSLAGPGSRLAHPSAVEIKNVRNMVQEILKQAAGRKIARLNIADHGSKGALEFGDDVITSPSKTPMAVQKPDGTFQPSNIEVFAAELGQLKGNFTADAVVHLQHCHGGSDLELLKAFSQILGARVYGGTGYDSGPVNFGTYNYCDPNGTCGNQFFRP